jgi:hypothetical protein
MTAEEMLKGMAGKKVRRWKRWEATPISQIIP